MIDKFSNPLHRAYDKYKESDNGTVHSYIEFYEGILFPYRNKKINLLEIGIWKGGSLLMWDEYFSKAKIFGIETSEFKWPDSEVKKNIEVIQGDGSSSEILNNSKLKNVKFDIIIDDANHNIKQQQDIFNVFYKRLKKNGLYIIEDVENQLSALKLVNMGDNGVIIDRRKVKQRFDDLLVIFYKD